MHTGRGIALIICWITLISSSNLTAQHNGFTSVYDKLRSRDSTITHMLVDWRGPERTVRARLRGTFVIAAGETGVRTVGRGGVVEFEERQGGTYRRLQVREKKGKVEYRYFVNFEPKQFDAEARRWFAELLREIVRETGITSRLRVERILASGGVTAVFREIDAIESERSRRMYYERLLESTVLPADTLAMIVQRIRGVFSADRNIELVLEAVLQQENCTPAVLSAIIRTSREINDERSRADLLADVALVIPEDELRLREQLEAEVGRLRSEMERRRVLTVK